MSRGMFRLIRAATSDPVAADDELLTAFVDGGDGAAFAALVRRHGPMVFGVCRRTLGHHQDAEDAFQATFLVLARRAADVWPRAAVGPWLHGVAYRVAGKARSRQAARIGREGALPADVAASDASPPEPDLPGAIDAAVHRLPAVYRAAVVACDLEGLSRADAATRLGWKEGTLSGRLARGRRLLAERLRRQGVTVPTAGLAALAGGPLEAVPVSLAERTVQLSGWQAATVSPAVAALTAGVIRTMIAAKYSFGAAAMAAVLVAGFGVWSAANGGGQDAKPADKPPAAKKAEVTRLVEAREPTQAEKDLAAMQGDWILGERYLVMNYSLQQAVIDAAIKKVREDGSLILFSDNKMSWLLNTTNAMLVGNVEVFDMNIMPRTFTVSLDPSQSPKHIDLTDEKGVATHGIYKFEGSYLKLCVRRGGQPGRPKGFDLDQRQPDEPITKFWQPRLPPRNEIPEGMSVSPDDKPDYTALNAKLAGIRNELIAAERELADPKRPRTTAREMAIAVGELQRRLDIVNTALAEALIEYEAASVMPKLPKP